MHGDWVDTLQEQAVLVIRVARDVANEIDASDLTLERASRLYRTVELGAQDFDRVIELMNKPDLEELFSEAAETIEDTWTNLSVATANRLRTMRGLDPIDVEADENNNG